MWFCGETRKWCLNKWRAAWHLFMINDATTTVHAFDKTDEFCIHQHEQQYFRQFGGFQETCSKSPCLKMDVDKIRLTLSLEVQNSFSKKHLLLLWINFTVNNVAWIKNIWLVMLYMLIEVYWRFAISDKSWCLAKICSAMVCTECRKSCCCKSLELTACLRPSESDIAMNGLISHICCLYWS